MRTKTVKRHWCDFCNKAGMQAKVMANHEARCTLNPARSCRVCQLLEGGECEDKKPLADLIAMLPDPTEFLASSCWSERDSPYTKLTEEIDAVIPAFRAAAGHCPACMLAAIRQKKIYVSMVSGFDFKGEMQSIFNDINSLRADERGY